MANPFSIEPANPLQALMLGSQGYKQGREIQQQNAIDDAADALLKNDLTGATNALVRGGQLGPGIALMKLVMGQKAGEDFAKSVGGVLGPQAQPSPETPAPSQPRPQMPPAPVASAPEPVSSGTPMPPGQNLTDQGTPISMSVQNTDPHTGRPLGPPTVTPLNGQAGAPSMAPAPSISPTIGGHPLDKAVPALLQAAANPNLDKSAQDTARMLLGKAMDQYPQEIRQLEIFNQRPDLFAKALELKRAGSTLINTAEGMDAAQTKARIEIDKDAVKSLGQKVAAGHAAIPILNQILQMGDKVPGGWAGTASPIIAKAASTFGIPVPEGASNAELLAAMSRQFIPTIRDPGSTSNYEQSLYTSSVPALSQSVEGRTKIARMFKATIERNQEAFAIYRQYVGRPELDQKLRELDQKPMFSDEDRKTLEATANAVAPNGGQSGNAGGFKWSLEPK